MPAIITHDRFAHEMLELPATSFISSTEEKSIAMDARAFSAPVSHTFLSELPPAGRREKGIVYLFDAAFIMLIIGRILLCIL